MITELETERDFLRAVLKSPQFGLPDYASDPIAQSQVGKAIAAASIRIFQHSVEATAKLKRADQNS